MVQARLSARHGRAGLVRGRAGTADRNDAHQSGNFPTVTPAPNSKAPWPSPLPARAFRSLTVVGHGSVHDPDCRTPSQSRFPPLSVGPALEVGRVPPGGPRRRPAPDRGGSALGPSGGGGL